MAPNKTSRKNHLAQSRWKDTQPNYLHHGEETIENKCEHCQDRKLPRNRYWKRACAGHDDLPITSEEGEKHNTRIRFDLEKLKDPEVAEIFQSKIGGKFAALSILDSDMDMDMLTNTFNTAVTDTANEILSKFRSPSQEALGHK